MNLTGKLTDMRGKLDTLMASLTGAARDRLTAGLAADPSSPTA